MAIEYTGFQRPSRLASTTRMAQAEFSGTLTFEPAGAGTRLRWSWDARFTWPPRLLAPVLARDAQMTLTGAPARLRPLPRLLLRTEVPVSGSAAGAALLACWQQRPGVVRVAAAAAAATFAVASPGRSRNQPAWPAAFPRRFRSGGRWRVVRRRFRSRRAVRARRTGLWLR